MGVALYGFLALMFVASVWMMWRDRQFAYQHRHEYLEVTLDGLTWQSDAQRIEAKWDEVRAIHFVPGRKLTAHYRVETARGDFSVWKELESLASWLRLVRHFSPQIAPEPPQTSVDLGGEVATWSGGEIGKGARIFHFRTSETRAVLWLPTFIAPSLLLIPYFHQSLQMPDDSPAASLPIFVWLAIGAALLATILCWIFFQRAAIWADETGLEWRFLFRKTRRVAWREIEAIGRDESGVFIRANGQKRRLWLGFAPARHLELLQLIENRATQATGRFG